MLFITHLQVYLTLMATLSQAAATWVQLIYVILVLTYEK